MKQVTGKTNVRDVSREVSIQLLLDGHSFSELRPSGAAAPPKSPGTIGLLTRKTLLVPAEFADESRGAELLAAAGMALDRGECAYWLRSEPGDRAAVAAIDGELLQRIHACYGKEARYTTPLLHPLSAERPAAAIDLLGGLLYIKVSDGDLQLAEVLPVAEESEVLFLLGALQEEFRLADYELHLTGDFSRSLLNIFKTTFKRVICE